MFKNDAFTGFNHDMLERVRELRHNMTKQERKLWFDFLRDYPVKIYRQRSIDRFIADFYCHRAHLVIEIDGGQHLTEQGKAYDKERSEWLAKRGLKVLRFSNEEIDRQFSAVCSKIEKIIYEELLKFEK